MNTKMASYAIAFMACFSMVVYLGVSEGDAEKEQTAEKLQSTAGKITDAETYVTDGGITYQLLSLSDGKKYVIKHAESDLIYTVGDEVSLDISEEWGRFEGERFYERYPDAITARNASLVSMPVIIEGEHRKLDVE